MLSPGPLSGCTASSRKESPAAAAKHDVAVLAALVELCAGDHECGAGLAPWQGRGLGNEWARRVRGGQENLVFANLLGPNWSGDSSKY